MTTANPLSERRRQAGLATLALATLSLVIVLSQSLGALLFSRDAAWFRLSVIFAASLAMISISALICRTNSVYWQIPLLSVSLALFLVGIPVLVSGVFSEWQELLGSTGLRASFCVALGISAAWLLRRLQASIPDDREA